jgi:hypothetical protein
MGNSTNHTPGPMRASDTDGRHKRVAIMAHGDQFKDEDLQPYHPLIGVVYYGGQHAPREVANATASLFAAAPDLLAVCERVFNHPLIRITGDVERDLIAALAKARGEA